MGKLQTAIQVLIGEQYGRGMDGQKIARRLIEAGLEMMVEEEQGGYYDAIDVWKGALPWRCVLGYKGISSYAFGNDIVKSDAVRPVEHVSKARSSDGTLALSVAPCRAEIVSWIMSKAAKAKKDGLDDVFFILQALAGEIEQHLEERPVNVAVALRDFYADCHARNVKAGWWTDLATGKPMKRSVGELFMLFVTEISEAYDAWLTGEPDDKLPQFPGLGVELGDLQIRLADFAGALLAGSIVANSETDNPGDAMFREVCEIARRYESIRKTDAAKGGEETGDFIPSADVGEMVVAKLEFNANRPDHKIENRLKEDGKRT